MFFSSFLRPAKHETVISESTSAAAEEFGIVTSQCRGAKCPDSRTCPYTGRTDGPWRSGLLRFRHAISMARLVRPAKYRGLDEHAYLDQGGITPFVRA